MQALSKSIVTVQPTLEPLTLDEAKRQVYVATSDNSHDQHLIGLITAAREQWEHDTDTAVMTQTVRMQFDGFCSEKIPLLRRPIQSITSITYYDVGNISRTIASGYSLNVNDRSVTLDFTADWPATYDRWDAVTVDYIAGYTTRTAIPMIAKQAILLLIGYYFEQRGDGDRLYDMRAYENLVKRYMRSSYP